MATASSVVELKDVKTCVVCHNALNEPRYLECLHSFCKLCIYSFAVRKLGTFSYIRCPICEVMNKVNDKEVDKWIEALPSSTFPQNINDDGQCEPCKERGNKTVAELYCSQCNEMLCIDCTNVHRSMKISKNHTILLLRRVVSTETGGIFCPKHQYKILSSFCIAHRIKCCPTCRITDHLTCNVTKARMPKGDNRTEILKLSTISEQFKLLLERGTYDRLSTAFNNIRQVLQNKTKDCQKRRDDLETQRASCNENIENICFKIEELLQRVKTLRPVLDSEFRTHIDRTHCEEEIVKEKEILVEEFQNILSTSQSSISETTSQSSISETIYVVTAEHLSQQRYQMEKFLSTKSRDVADTLKVEYNKILLELLDLTNQEPINVVMSELPSSFRCRLLKHCIPYKADEMSLTWSSRQHGVTHITDLSENRILLVDNTCKQVYIYNSRDKIESMFELGRKPWTAVFVNQNILVSVTARYMKRIDVEKLDFGKDLVVSDLVRCVAYYKDKFVVTSESSVMVINLEGQIMRSFKVDNPRYIYVDRYDRFYFRNGVRNTLFCTSEDFEVIFVYSHPQLKVIGGITLDSEDNIYVVGHLSNNIHQLFPDGSFNRILLSEKHGLFKPIYLHFLEGSNKFLLSNDGGQAVEVYEME